MFPALATSEENTKNFLEKYRKKKRYSSKDSLDNENIMYLIKKTEKLELLKEKKIINDEIYYYGMISTIARFIAKEINNNAYRIIIESLISNLVHEEGS